MIKTFLWQHKYQYAVGILSILFAEILQVQIPQIIGHFTNQVKTSRNLHAIALDALTLVAVGISYVAIFGIGQFLIGRLGRIHEKETRQKLFAHWETLSVSYFREHSTGNLISHALNDMQTIREAMSGGINQLFQAIFLFLAAFIMALLHVNIALTLAAMIPLSLIPLVMAKLGMRVRQTSRRVKESLSDMADFTEDSLTAIRLIKATGTEPTELERYQVKVKNIFEASWDLATLNSVFQTIPPLLLGLSFVITIAYGGWLTIKGTINLGSFVAFTIYLRLLAQPLMQLGNVFNSYQMAQASITRIEKLLSVKPDIMDAPHPMTIDPSSLTLEVNHLDFSYPQTSLPTLQDISFTITPGQVVGIVGRTGSGKTTLLNLLLRINDAPAGTIFLNGIDIRELSRNDLRQHVAYVPQDGFLFSTSLADNVAFSQQDIVDHTITRAIHTARLSESVKRFPQGIHTPLGERGITLSGGQRQRSSIARALIKESASIVIFDDSLSAVDTKTEQEILSELNRWRGHRSLIIASHRLSAVANADFIIVLDQGRIVEMGPHPLLMQNNHVYARMYGIQYGWETAQ